MKLFHRSVLYIGALWEIVRFLFLFTGVSLLVNPGSSPLVNLHLLWLSAGQVCTAALFFIGGYAPEKFPSLRGVTAFFKFAGLLPAAAAAASGFLVPPTALAARPTWGAAGPAALPAVDFIFLVYLIKYAPDRDSRSESGPAPEAPNLPDFRETRVEEK